MASATTTTTKRQRKPVPRSLRWEPAAGPGLADVVRLTVGKDTCAYAVQELPADDGRGFAFHKLDLSDPTTHHVQLHDDGRATCDCRGHQRWNHCKHSDGLLKLLELGKLPAAMPAEVEGRPAAPALLAGAA